MAAEEKKIATKYIAQPFNSNWCCSNDSDGGDACPKQGTLRCPRCRVAYYCSSHCQSRDWRAKHARLCPLLAQSKKVIDETYMPPVIDLCRWAVGVRDFVRGLDAVFQRRNPLFEYLTCHVPLIKSLRTVIAEYAVPGLEEVVFRPRHAYFLAGVPMDMDDRGLCTESGDRLKRLKEASFVLQYARDQPDATWFAEQWKVRLESSGHKVAENRAEDKGGFGRGQGPVIMQSHSSTAVRHVQFETPVERYPIQITLVLAPLLTIPMTGVRFGQSYGLML